MDVDDVAGETAFGTFCGCHSDDVVHVADAEVGALDTLVDSHTAGHLSLVPGVQVEHSQEVPACGQLMLHHPVLKRILGHIFMLVYGRRKLPLP